MTDVSSRSVAAADGARRALGSGGGGIVTMVRRDVQAALIDARVYEEVEADRQATGQAAAIVILSSVCAGIGVLRPGASVPLTFVEGTSVELLAWMTWAAITYLIGTRL